MDCSTSGFPILHYLLELAQTHVHWVGDAIQQVILSYCIHFDAPSSWLLCPFDMSLSFSIFFLLMQNDKTRPPGQVLQLPTSPNELWSGSFRDQDLGIAHAHCWWGAAATRRSKWTDTVHTHTHIYFHVYFYIYLWKWSFACSVVSDYLRPCGL